MAQAAQEADLYDLVPVHNSLYVVSKDTSPLQEVDVRVYGTTYIYSEKLSITQLALERYVEELMTEGCVDRSDPKVTLIFPPHTIEKIAVIRK